VKCNLNVYCLKVRAGQLHASKAQKQGRVIAHLNARREEVAITLPQPLYPWEEDPVPTVQEAGWASGLVWISGKSCLHLGLNPTPSCL